MTHIISITQLPKLTISIKIIGEIIYQTNEACAKLFPLTKQLTKQTLFSVSEELIQIKFNSYQYISKTLSDGQPNPFYNDIYKNQISFYLDDDIIDLLAFYKLQTGRHFTEYLGTDVNTQMKIHTLKGKTVLHCSFNINDNLGSNFRSNNPAKMNNIAGRCILKLRTRILYYNDNTMAAYLSFIISKIEVTKKQPIAITEGANP